MNSKANNSKIKLAIIGGGKNSAVGYAHLSALFLTNKFEIIAACFSRHSDVNTESANFYNIKDLRLYNTFEELISEEKSNLDCVLLLTPTDSHFNCIKTCLNNNLSVICEKAITSTLEQAIEIRDILSQKQLFFSVIYNYIGYPMIRELRNMIDEGQLGTINQILIEMPQEGFLKTKNGNIIKPQEWRLKDNTIPTLSLDLGVHLHIIIRYLTQKKPLEAIAIYNTYGNFEGIVDDLNCFIKYEDKLTCNMWYSKVALGYRNGLKVRVFGSKASAEWYQEDSEILKLANQEGHRWVLDRGVNTIKIANQERYTRFKVGHPAGFIEALANYYEDIVQDFINYKEEPSVKNTFSFGIDESIEGLDLLNTLSVSAKTTGWVKIK